MPKSITLRLTEPELLALSGILLESHVGPRDVVDSLYAKVKALVDASGLETAGSMRSIITKEEARP